MALSVNTSGSQTAVISTEHTLATITDPNVYCLAVDVANMVWGTSADILTVKVYGKARSSDTERLLKTYSLVGAQDEALFQTPCFVSPHSIRFTITQSQGTGRAFPWAVYQVQ